MLLFCTAITFPLTLFFFFLGSGFLQEVEVWLGENPVKVELESLHSLGQNIFSTFLAESILQARYI